MKISSFYNRKEELPYCCVPAVLQMVFERRGLPIPEQENIGYELGLIVPPEEAHIFRRVRTGPKPPTGWGTQTRLAEFSIQGYFDRYNYHLQLNRYLVSEIADLKSFLVNHLTNSNDVIVCFNQQQLSGIGDEEHVALIQNLKRKSVLLVDPAKSNPDPYYVTFYQLVQVLIEFWVIKEKID